MRAEVTPPTKLSEYVLPEHCDTFFGKKERIYLHGEWKFKQVAGESGYDETKGFFWEGVRDGRIDLKQVRFEEVYDETDPGSKEQYWRVDHDDSQWTTQLVPTKIFCDPRNKTGTEPGIGYYRRSVMIPGKHEGKRAVLVFQRVSWQPIIWLNGKEIARPRNLIPGKCADVHAIDITDDLRWGEKNQITVRICIRPSKRGNHLCQHSNGIWEPVWIEFRPPVYCREMLIIPRLPDTIDVRCLVINTHPRKRTVTFQGEVLPWHGDETYQARLQGTSTVTDFRLEEKTLQPGENRFEFRVKINEPVLWDVHNPFLYSLKMHNGVSVAGWERFGLREFTVKDQYFYLNGHRVFLSGLSTECNIIQYLQRIQPDFYQNRNNFLRKFLRILRDGNILFVSGPERIAPPIYLDICDELGILCKPVPDVMKECVYSKYAMELAITDLEGFLRTAIRRNIVEAYNHPSCVIYSPEGESTRTPDIMRVIPLYRRIIHEYDPSSRLFTCAQTSPRMYPEKGLPYPPFDFLNNGPLIGSYTGVLPFTFIPDHVKYRSLLGAGYYDGNTKPCIYTEAFYGAALNYRRHWDRVKTSYGKNVVENGQVNKKLYCDLYGITTEYQFMIFHYSDVKVVGVRNALDLKTLIPGIAGRVGQMIELTRMNDQYVQGFGSRAGPVVEFTADPMDMDPAIIKENAFTRIMKKTCAPVFVCADLHCRHNPIAGNELSARIFCFNYRFRDLHDVRVGVALLHPTGDRIYGEDILVGKLADGAREEIAHKHKLAEDLRTGNYILQINIEAGGQVHSENEYGLFILGRADLGRKISTGKRVALLGAGEFLDRLGVGYEPLTDFNKLQEYDVIIIGKDEASKISIESGKKIIAYLENGGRVVCLEQHATVPWFEDLHIESVRTRGKMQRRVKTNLAVGIEADLIEEDHPVFAGIDRRENWKLWSAPPYGAIYTHLALPLSEGVILAGGTNGGRKGGTEAPFVVFGMLIAEIKVGKGVLMLSQVEAVDLYGIDAVATKYLHNLFAYTLAGPWIDKYAAPLRGNVQYGKHGLPVSWKRQD